MYLSRNAARFGGIGGWQVNGESIKGQMDFLTQSSSCNQSCLLYQWKIVNLYTSVQSGANDALGIFAAAESDAMGLVFVLWLK